MHVIAPLVAPPATARGVHGSFPAADPVVVRRGALPGPHVRTGGVKTRLDSAGTAKLADSRGRFATRPKHDSVSAHDLAVEIVAAWK